MKSYQICPNPRCGYAYNSLQTHYCELCEEKLTPSPELLKVESNPKPPLRVGHKKKLTITAIFLLVAVGLGFSHLTASFPPQAKATRKLPTGLLRYWGPPCSQRLISQKIARVIGQHKQDQFKLLWIDVDQNRDALAELIDKQISLVLHEKVQFPQYQQKAHQQGVNLKGIPYALDGIAYIVNNRLAPVPSLTIEDLEKIYQGEITNWQEVGGEDRTIKPILLSGLGRNSLFLDFQGKLNPQMVYVQNRQKAMSVLKQQEGTIFYTSATLAAEEKGIQIIPLKNDQGEIIPPVVEGKANQEAISNGSYPQIRTLFAIHREEAHDEESEMVQAFIDYLTSPEGQSLVKKAGFVPLYLPL